MKRPSSRAALPALPVLPALPALLALLALLLLPIPADARDLARVDDPWERARAFYGAGDFDQARLHIIEAIQREPARSELYLGLARTLFQVGDYDAAVFYYDVYLREFPLPEGASRDERAAHQRAVTERGGANQERARPTDPVAADPRREAAAARFRDTLASGPIVSTREASASELWEVLLRTGFVHPDLAPLRTQLREAALAEALATVDPEAFRIPALSQEEWEAQARRVRIAKELVPGVEDPEPGPNRARAQAALATARAQQQMLRRNESAALPLFRSAHEADPTYLPAAAGILNATALDPELRDPRNRDAMLRLLDARDDDDARLLARLYRALLGSGSTPPGNVDGLAEELIRRTP